jgi:EspG family
MLLGLNPRRMLMAETSIEFTYDELAIVTRQLGCDMPVGVAADDIELPPSVVERLEASARAALGARRILTGTDADSVNSAVKSLLDLAASPKLVVSIEIDESDVVETTFLLCDEDLGVEVAPVAGSVYRFTPYITRDLVRRVLKVSDLRPATPVLTECLRLTVEQIEHAALIADNDVFAGSDYLSSVGVPKASAGLFADALAQRRRSVSVTALHRPEDSRVEGGTMSWIDCGIAGNWLSEAVEGDPDQLDVRSVSIDELVAMLVSYLPDAFGSSSSLG